MSSFLSPRNLFSRTPASSAPPDRTSAQRYAEQIKRTRLSNYELNLQLDTQSPPDLSNIDADADTDSVVNCCERPLSPSQAIDQVIEALRTLKKMPSKCLNKLLVQETVKAPTSGLTDKEQDQHQHQHEPEQRLPQLDQDVIPCAPTLSSLECSQNRVLHESRSKMNLHKSLPPLPKSSVLIKDSARPMSSSSDLSHRRGAIDHGSPVMRPSGPDSDARSWSSSWYHANKNVAEPYETNN